MEELTLLEALILVLGSFGLGILSMYGVIYLSTKEEPKDVEGTEIIQGIIDHYTDSLGFSEGPVRSEANQCNCNCKNK